MSQQERQPRSPEPAALYHSYLFVPVECQVLPKLSLTRVLPVHDDAHQLIFFNRDHGVLQLEGHMIRADQGSAVLLAPGAKASVQFSDAAAAEEAVFVVAFAAYRLGEARPAREMLSSIPYETRIDIGRSSRFLELLGLLRDHTSGRAATRDPADGDPDALGQPGLHGVRSPAADELDALRQQMRLLEMFILLMEHAQMQHALSDTARAVEQTVAYIERHYQENITARQLYRMAGVAKWQYSTLFQSLTGRKPLEYLLEVRLNRAKQLLVETDDTLGQIARHVGFKDESYFGRKFRQSFGMTPRNYAELARQSASGRPAHRYERIVAVGYSLGDLLALGIRPVGADLHVIGKRVIYRDMLKQIKDVGLLGEPGKVRALQPDLIVYSSFRQDWVDELSRIAPTVLIDRYEPTYSRIVKVAELFGKQEQAKRWVEQHRSLSEQMWDALGKQMNVRQTASIFVMVEGNLYVLGMKGFALTIYHPHGFRPADSIKALIEAKIPFRLIDQAQVSEYRADIHFLLIDEHPLSREAAERLAQGTYLRGLGKDRFFITENKWNFDDPITMDRLIPVLPRILLRAGT